MYLDHDSDYLQTRLSLFADRLMSVETLAGMVQLDVGQLVERINALHSRVDNVLDDAGSHVGGFLAQHMFNDFRVLLRPFHGIKYRFLKQSMRWFELVNLKVLIRGKFTGVSEVDLTSQLVELGGFADLPLRKLVETDDPFEMLRLLELTSYGGIVRQARRVYEEQGHDLFSLDSAIDRTFFIGVAYRAQYLSLRDRTLLNSVLGALLDRFNLLWLLRYRFSYGLSSAKSYYLLTASGRHLHSTELMRLARVESLDEVLEALPPVLKRLLGGVKSLFEVEQLMELYSLSAAAKGLKHGNSLVARTFSYLLLREAETRYLTAIVKGKRLGFDDELIGEALGVKA